MTDTMRAARARVTSLLRLAGYPDAAEYVAGDYMLAEMERAALAAAPQPATPGERMIRAAEEAVAIARGEAEPASVYPAETDWGPDVGKEVLPPYQPAPVDREALVGVIRAARCEWANDGDSESCPDQAIADALLARGLRLPGPETMAWAVVGKRGWVMPGNTFANQEAAERFAWPHGRIVRVAIRVVEGGDDAA